MKTNASASAARDYHDWGNIADLIILPSQWQDMHPTSRPGEYKLLLAILEDAINCYQYKVRLNGSHNTVQARTRIKLNADCWFGLCSQQHVCNKSDDMSFEVVCDYLGLDHVSIRDALRRQQQPFKLIRHVVGT